MATVSFDYKTVREKQKGGQMAKAMLANGSALPPVWGFLSKEPTPTDQMQFFKVGYDCCAAQTEVSLWVENAKISFETFWLYFAWEFVQAAPEHQQTDRALR